MRRDHRPYLVKKALTGLERLYVRWRLAPQLEALGEGAAFVRPWYVRLFGAPIRLGRCVNVVAAPDRRVRLSVWGRQPGLGGIEVGDFCLIGPGVRISSAHGIRIGDNCMLADGVYLTDADWHDAYNRVSMGPSAPIEIGTNVWVGDGAVVCKGVTVGANSIVGAGAVVVRDIPPNSVAAGNPARVVKSLDPGRPFKTRAEWFGDPAVLARGLDAFDRRLLAGNSLGHWLRWLLLPSRED